MTIIDAHAHIGGTDTPDRLIGLMDEVGIARAVVTTYADVPGPGDALGQLRDAVARYPDRLIGFPRMDPRYGRRAVELFARSVRDEGMRGLKLHPVSNLSFPYERTTLALLDRAAELDVPVLIHSGDELLCTPQEIAEAARQTRATILMAHIGGYQNAHAALEAAVQNDNIRLETSACPYPSVIQAAVDQLGAERVVYGSDMPPANPRVELAKIEILDLTDDQREMILGRNIAELVNISEDRP